MSTSILITIPEETASEFIDHLGKLRPDIAKDITIRLLSDYAAQKVIDDFESKSIEQIEPELRWN